jgi:hypothetical protein
VKLPIGCSFLSSRRCIAICTTQVRRGGVMIQVLERKSGTRLTANEGGEGICRYPQIINHASRKRKKATEPGRRWVQPPYFQHLHPLGGERRVHPRDPLPGRRWAPVHGISGPPGGGGRSETGKAVGDIPGGGGMPPAL